MLLPVGSVASAVLRDLCQDQLGGQRRLVRWAAILCFAFFAGTLGSRNTITDGPAPLRAAPRIPVSPVSSLIAGSSGESGARYGW